MSDSRASYGQNNLICSKLAAMIDISQINDHYYVGRERPSGKVYVMGPNEAKIASYSGLTETLEWYQTVSPEETTLIEAYLRQKF
jgi:hypothetical protein